MRQLSLAIVGIATFVVLWLTATAFLAQDACLDRGGTFSGPWFACLLPSGVALPWFALVRPMQSMVVIAVTGWPVLLLVRYLLRSGSRNE